MTNNYMDTLYPELHQGEKKGIKPSLLAQEILELQRRTGISDESRDHLAMEWIATGHVNGHILQMLDEQGQQLPRAVSSIGGQAL